MDPTASPTDAAPSAASRRRSVALFAGLALPGAGQVALGLWRMGVVVGLVFVVLVFAGATLFSKGEAMTIAGVAVLTAAALLQLGAAVAAFLQTKRAHARPRWWKVICMWAVTVVALKATAVGVHHHVGPSYAAPPVSMLPSQLAGDRFLAPKLAGDAHRARNGHRRSKGGQTRA